MLIDKRMAIWTIAIFFFVVIRSIFFDLFSYASMISFIIYAVSVFWIVCPFLLGTKISIPPYSHDLKKGADDGMRMIMFIVGVILCASAVVSGA